VEHVVIRVVIADDEQHAREKLSRWLGGIEDIELVAQCTDGIAAAEAIEQHRPDVAFLDIQMPALSGLEVAAQLEETDAPLVVFVTAFDEHAIKAFDLSAVDYLLKPYDKDRLLRALARVRERLSASSARASVIAVARTQAQPQDRLLVPVGEKLQLIDAAAIDWLEADDNYVHVHAGSRDYLLRRTLQDLVAQLGADRFVRIHKSTAVNIAAVLSLSPLFKGDYELTLRTSHTLRMSRRFKDELFARMGK
jgi:two-component system, LytTR family, response regulator